LSCKRSLTKEWENKGLPTPGGRAEMALKPRADGAEQY